MNLSREIHNVTYLDQINTSLPKVKRKNIDMNLDVKYSAKPTKTFKSSSKIA